MRSVIVDVVVALLILMISGSVLNGIAGVEEGETAPVWAGILPLVLAMVWLLWRTTRRRRAQAEQAAREDANAPTQLEDAPELTLDDDSWNEMSIQADAASLEAPMDAVIWRSRVETAVRNLGQNAFEQFTLQIVSALQIRDVRIERIAFDGAIECVGREAPEPGAEPGADSPSVYIICRRSFGSLGANQVRDLRQQMEGKADEGLFISNGEFSSSAVTEAENEPTIDLIDGNALIDLMREHSMGVFVNENGDVLDVDDAWFSELDEEVEAGG